MNKKRKEQHWRENISSVQSSEYCEIKCLFGLSKGTVMLADFSIFIWNIKNGEIKNAWDFLILSPSIQFTLLPMPNLAASVPLYISLILY